MKENILKLFIEKGFLLDSDMLNFLNELKDEGVASEILNKIAFISHEKLITKNLYYVIQSGVLRRNKLQEFTH